MYLVRRVTRHLRVGATFSLYEHTMFLRVSPSSIYTHLLSFCYISGVSFLRLFNRYKMPTFFVHIFSYHKACSEKFFEITKFRKIRRFLGENRLVFWDKKPHRSKTRVQPFFNWTRWRRRQSHKKPRNSTI